MKFYLIHLSERPMTKKGESIRKVKVFIKTISGPLKKELQLILTIDSNIKTISPTTNIKRDGSVRWSRKLSSGRMLNKKEQMLNSKLFTNNINNKLNKLISIEKITIGNTKANKLQPNSKI